MNRKVQSFPSKRIYTAIMNMGKTPLLELVIDPCNEIPYWRIWISYNGGITEGTYIRLFPHGEIWRETISPEGSVQTVVITPGKRKTG